MCGPNSGIFNAGWCHLTWTYILSILAMFDISCLTVLAVCLAICRPMDAVKTRHIGVNNMDNYPYGNGFTVFPTTRDLYGSKFETNYQRPENNRQNYQERCI
uniref:Uncharacterized protein n=1 Tax=Romanomermis culicivorax TaxID=13658 RepID=A0A915I4U7_ROMCU